MADLCDYADRPLVFILRYVRQRPISHAAILTAVLAAVGCSVGTQYGVKISGRHAFPWRDHLRMGGIYSARPR